MSLTIKAFLYQGTWKGDPIEIRRFTIDQDVTSSFAYLVEKVVQVFPSLKPGNFVAAWTDSEGDVVTLSSDEELVEALDQFEGGIFRLYLKKVPSSEESKEQSSQESKEQQQDGANNFHPGIVCDGCSGPVYGTRFKCLICPDYDLCSSCEGKGLHVDHNMITITEPWRFHGCPRGRFGPFRGGRGRCGGRGGRGGCPYRGPPPGFFAAPWGAGFGRGGGCQGGGAQWWRRPGEEQEPSKAAEKDAATATAEGEQPMDTGSGASHQEEDRRTFLQGIGKAVTDFLEPFGIKVDVDVFGGEKAAEPKDADPSSTPATEQPQVSDEVVEEALAQLSSMGYQDEGGWLKELVQAKGGDVSKVLDALHPTVEKENL